MTPMNRTVRAAQEVTKAREPSGLKVAAKPATPEAEAEFGVLSGPGERSTPRNPMILPQPPTKPPKCRRKTDNSRGLQVRVRSSPKLSARTPLNFRGLRLGYLGRTTRKIGRANV